MLLIIYAIGFVFHAWCAYLELTHWDRKGVRVTLLEHMKATVLLFFWPIVPIKLLLEVYYGRIAFFTNQS